MRKYHLIIILFITFLIQSCTKNKESTGKDGVIVPHLNSKAILNVFISESSNKSIKLIEKSLKLTEADDHKSKADYYNLLSYIYKSILDYPNFVSYNKLALKHHKIDTSGQVTNSAILLNNIKTYYEFGNDQKAIELLSTKVSIDNIKCESETIKENGFFYLEYAYLLALTNNIKKAQTIIKKCTDQILQLTSVKNKFKKNVHFYSSLISAISGDIVNYRREIKRYKDLTPTSLVPDHLLAAIADICTFYKSGNQELALQSLDSYSALIMSNKQKLSTKYYELLEKELRERLLNDKSISAKYGHWYRYCNKK